VFGTGTRGEIMKTHEFDSLKINGKLNWQKGNLTQRPLQQPFQAYEASCREVS